MVNFFDFHNPKLIYIKRNQVESKLKWCFNRNYQDSFRLATDGFSLCSLNT